METVEIEYKSKEPFKKKKSGVRYLTELWTDNISKFGSNFSGEIDIVSSNGKLYPVLISKKYVKNICYLLSPISQFTDFIEEEIFKNNDTSTYVKKTLKIGISTLRNALNFLELNNSIYVNNYLLSTNLYDSNSSEDVDNLVIELLDKYPKKAIVFKSVNSITDCGLFQKLSVNNFLPIVSRQIYLLNTSDKSFLKKRNLVNDRKHWQSVQSDFEWVRVGNISDEEANILLEQYMDLYVHKHNSYNPKYTIEYIKMAVKTDLMDCYLLKYKDQTVGCSFFYEKNNVLTTPFISYNQELNDKLGLYRILSYLLITEAEKRNLLLNMSSGAGDFKKKRGGSPRFEYNFVKIDHLPLKQKLGWKIIYFLGQKIAKPLMIKHGL